MKRFLLLIPLVGLTACATWAGRSQADLVKHFGVPNQTIQTSSGEIYQYQDCDNAGTTVSAGNGVYVNSGGGCSKKMFLLKDGKIIKDLGTVYQ